MSGFKKLSHSIWECKYHIVFCPQVSVPNIWRSDRGIRETTSIPSVTAEGSGWGGGDQCTAWSYTYHSLSSSQVPNIRHHGILERENVLDLSKAKCQSPI